MREHYSQNSNEFGRNTIRYLLLNLREETLESIMPSHFAPKLLCVGLYLSSKCYPFEENPFLSNLAGSRTSASAHIEHLISAAGSEKMDIVRPYLLIQNKIKKTGEIYFEIAPDSPSVSAIQRYNNQCLYCRDCWNFQIKAIKAGGNITKTFLNETP